jgi:hypothetical protein
MRILIRRGHRRRYAALLAAAFLLAGACSDAGSNGAAESEAAGSDADAPCYELGWKDCPEEPYPFSTPLPPVEPTAIDGTYTREVGEDLAWAPGKCKRCPPYRLEPGTETLTFDRGRFFVAHEAPGFTSSGHFWQEGSQIRLFNDASCTQFEGLYEWTVTDDMLHLEAIDDECPFTQLRQRYLMAKDWSVAPSGDAAAGPDCDPPSEEAAVTGHWPIPKECATANES